MKDASFDDIRVERDGESYTLLGASEGVDVPSPLFASIDFQDGTLTEVGLNGISMEILIEFVLIDRLRRLNDKFPCRENSLAITHLEEALLWLNRRTELRERQGVEGQHIGHES